ncbi:hypothetical protein KUCAC02_031488, partial [Chaenocephalus aceratus]
NVRFVMIALAFAVPTGVIAGWAGVLNMVGPQQPHCQGDFTVLYLQSEQPAEGLRERIHLSGQIRAILYTSCILVGIFINSSVPIFFELFIETVYPVPEGITCGLVTFLGNLVTGLLLFFLTFYCTDSADKRRTVGN